MQYLSTTASLHFKENIHIHSFNIPLDISYFTTNDVYDEHENFDNWLYFIEKTLLRLGITDVQCVSKKERDTKLNFQFFFNSELEMLQFAMAITADISGNYTREIQSNSPEQSLKREKNIISFKTANGIDVAIHRKNDTTFIITSDWLHSYLAIALQLVKKTFDKGQYPDRRRNHEIPALLRSFECS